MASNVLAGFVKGFADYGVNSINRREEAENELRKAKLLAQLQAETQKDLEEFRANLKAKDADKDLSSADFDNGQMILRNSRGEEVGRRTLTEDEKAAHKLSMDKGTLALEDTRSQIGYRQGQLANDSARIGLEGQRLGLERERLDLDKKTNGRTTLDGNPIAKAEYERTISELTKAGANPRVIANYQTAWQNGLDSGWTLAQQRVFLNRMREEFTRSSTRSDGSKGKPLLEMYPTVDPVLEGKMQGL